jgi:hypothetical protein
MQQAEALELKPSYSTVGKALRIALTQFCQIYNLFRQHFARAPHCRQA